LPAAVGSFMIGRAGQILVDDMQMAARESSNEGTDDYIKRTAARICCM